MRAGLPIVATRVGAIPEVVEDGVTGLLVPPDDPDALASAIVALLRDPAWGDRAGAAGFRRLRDEFSPERMAADVAGVYELALGRTASGAAGRARSPVAAG